MSSSKTFRARIEKHCSRSYVALPFDPNRAWGVKKRHSLTGTVGGGKWRVADMFFDPIRKLFRPNRK